MITPLVSIIERLHVFYSSLLPPSWCHWQLAVLLRAPHHEECALNSGFEGSSVFLGSGRIPGGGNGNLFQYSCLGNAMDRGAWQATVHEIAKNQTQPPPPLLVSPWVLFYPKTEASGTTTVGPWLWSQVCQVWGLEEGPRRKSAFLTLHCAQKASSGHKSEMDVSKYS